MDGDHGDVLFPSATRSSTELSQRRIGHTLMRNAYRPYSVIILRASLTFNWIVRFPVV